MIKIETPRKQKEKGNSHFQKEERERETDRQTENSQLGERFKSLGHVPECDVIGRGAGVLAKNMWNGVILLDWKTFISPY